jgi:septal ring factor EnvC (AmiA/AmiB activator)
MVFLVVLPVAPALAAPLTKAQAAELEAQERSLIAQLDALDRRLSQLKLDRRALAGDLKGLSAEEKAALTEALKLQAEGASLKSRLKSRLKALYLHGQTGLLRLNLTGPSLPEAKIGRAHV